MPRSSSAARLRAGGGPSQMGGGFGSPGAASSGMGERNLSLPNIGGSQRAGYPGVGERQTMRRAPSELLLERKEFGSVHTGQKPKITAFLDLAQYSNYTNPIVPVDQPLFSVYPPMITFSDFEGLQTYEAVVTLRNQDNVARRVKVCPPDTPFFELVAGRKIKQAASSSSTSNAGDKIAPGMEVSYTVRFKPDARIDYSHDLVVITEREKFTIPVRASGGSALLDFPDVIDFGNECVVGHTAERTVLVRNLGDRPTKFALQTSPPFTVVVPVDTLKENASCQVQVRFTPERAEVYEMDLNLKYGGMEATTLVCGSASNADVSMSHALLVIDDTYVGLETQAVVTIRNDSDVPVDFSWRLFPSVIQEKQYRAELHARLKLEERDETLYMQRARDGEDSSDDSCSDEERLRARRDAKVSSGLSRKYGNIAKAVAEDPMLFRDATFSITPASGRIWAHSQLTCACTFCPRDALVYSCTAYLSCVGREERQPLVLRGLGIGPKASFSYNELDVENVFVESAHRYEVQLLNQGDIEVDFQLTPPRGDSKFGKQFHFEPSSGTIAVGGQCEIVVDFKPSELGEFHEIFEWTLKGSATAITLAFRGKSVEPTFEFDVDKINFGTVSFGFLNSRMLTLMNTSEVPIVYTLRVPGDGNPPENEFSLIPSKGTLLPNCAQRVQVDFLSISEKKYDMRLAVDLQGVGKELSSIPITAQCAVPQVSFDPHGCLSYNDIFIRYPFHRSLYLHNTSTLPAKFEVMPQDDKSKAEFEPDQWVGTVPPCASHVITVTLTAHKTGAIRIPMYVKIHGRPVPFPLVLVANSIGPRVVVEPAILDWGSVQCLQPMVRHVKLTNNSCIDAHVRAFMNERRSLWSVHPKSIHLSPQETLQAAVTLVIDDCTNASDVLNLVVNESDDLTVNVKGKGISTPVRVFLCDKNQSIENPELIDFGKLFTTRTDHRYIEIKNYGKYARRIQWVREQVKRDKKSQQAEAADEKPPVFRFEQDSFTIDPKNCYKFTLLAMNPQHGIVEDSLVCQETPIDTPGCPKLGSSQTQARQICKPRFRAHFIAPDLKLSRSEVVFKFFWERDKPVEPMTQKITVSNPGDLEVFFKVQVQYPFWTDIDEAGIAPQGSQDIQISFDPAFKTDRKSGVTKYKMTIQYDDHPGSKTVDLLGKVVWPNIELESTKVDFGHVLNETTKKKEVKMHNPTALTVSYAWYFKVQGDKDEGGGRTPATPLITSTSQASGFRSGMPSQAGSMMPTGGSLMPPSGPPTAGATGLSMGISTGVPGQDDRSDLQSIVASTGFGGGTTAAPTGSEWHTTTTGHGGGHPSDVEINQIFDILPIFGKIEPGETQIATFSYCAMSNRSFKAIACCTVDGGPEYEVQLRGSASNCQYRLDKQELDFEEIPFTDIEEKEILLTNPGKVAATFNFNLSEVSRPFVVDITPPSGVIRPEEKVRCMVKFRAGIPDKVSETVLVEVAHFEPAKLTVKGSGTFPGIVVALPRVDESDHRQALEAASSRMGKALPGLEEALAELAAQQAALNPPAEGDEAAEADGAAAAAAPPGALQLGATEAIEEEPTGAALPQGLPENWSRLDNLDLELEFEVARYSLCEMLLKGASPGKGQQDQAAIKSFAKTATMGFGGAKGPRGTAQKGPPPVTAATYVCDFGFIALGQQAVRKFNVFNYCSEDVYVTIEKKALKEAGFLVEPETIKQLKPGKSVLMTVTAVRDRELDEGIQELEWNMPVRGGPNYQIKLCANFVLPELTLSSEAIDFGRLLVGQRKRVSLWLRNDKDVLVEWAYMEPRDRYGKKPSPENLVFDLSPSTGTLLPGERCEIVVSFSPKQATEDSATLQLKLKDNPKRRTISVQGRGENLGLEVRPSMVYDLGPIMPSREGCSMEFFLANPTDYPIEVYSVDFDKKYLAEENVLLEYDSYQQGLAEMPVRLPGDHTWQPIAQRVYEMRKGAYDAMMERGVEDDGESPEEPQPPPEAIFEGEEGPDSVFYPQKVKASERSTVVIFGPPKSGVTTLARTIAREQQRCCFCIDDAVDWACRKPKMLRPDRIAKKTIDALQAGGQITEEDLAHLLKRRLELPDCNAGVIIDSLQSQYLPSPQVLNAICQALKGEKLSFINLQLPAEEKEGDVALDPESQQTMKLPEPADLPEGGADVPRDAGFQGKAFMAYVNTLKAALGGHLETLKSKVTELEGASSAAEEALTAATEKEKEALAALEAAQTAAANPEAAGDVPEPAEEETSALEAALQAAQKAHESAKEEVLAARIEAFKAKQLLEDGQSEVARCEAAADWAPEPQPKPDDEPPTPPPDPKAKKSAPTDDQASAALSTKQTRDFTAAAAKFLDMEAGIVGALENYIAGCRREEEDKQRDLERRRRNRAAAQKAKARQQPNRAKAKPEPRVSLSESPEFQEAMDRWTPPVSVTTFPIQDPPFDELLEKVRAMVPMPSLPTEPALPPPSVVQLVTPPMPRPEYVVPANFSIITPIKKKLAEEAERSGSKEAAPPVEPVEGEEVPPEETEELIYDQTRWIIEPHEETRLLVHFNAEEVAAYSELMQFQLVDDVTGVITAINVSGISALPGISKDPRVVFARRKKKRPQDGSGYAQKAFVTSVNTYDFGPLLAGREVACRFPEPIEPVEEGEEGAAAEAAPPAEPIDADMSMDEGEPRLQDSQEMPTHKAVSPFVLRHCETIRISNDSLFPANVRIGLESAPPPSHEESPEAAEPAGGPFVVEPTSLQLPIGGSQEVKVWCFPTESGLIEDKLIAVIEHNPEPVTFQLCALGATPWAVMDREEVDFGRLMKNLRAEDEILKLKNESTLPVRWQFQCLEVECTGPDGEKLEVIPAPFMKTVKPPKREETEGEPAEEEEPPPVVPQEFFLDAMEGTLAGGEERDLRIGFRAGQSATFRFALGLEVKDAEGFKPWQSAGRLEVKSMTYAVDVEVEPDPRDTALDFGTVRVGTSSERTFDIVNKGRFPVNFELSVRRALRDMLTVDNLKDDLPPGERRTVKVTCTPTRIVEAANEREGLGLMIFDTMSGESVNHGIPPLRVAVTAVYNAFQVTPPRGVNFGPVEKGEVQTRSYTVRNVGIFAFDWCMFDFFEPPEFGEDGKPPPTAGPLKVGQFTVKPTSGKLEPDEEAQIEVVFEASGDQDYDSKVAVWVEGVQDGDGAMAMSPMRAGGQPGVTGGFGAAANLPCTSAYLLSGKSCIPGINTTDLQTVFEEQFYARTLEDAVAIAGRPDVRVYCEADQIFSFGPVRAQRGDGGQSMPPSPVAGALGEPPRIEGVTEMFRLSNPKAIPCKVDLVIRGKAGETDLPFEVIPDNVVIQPYDSAQISVKFNPPRLASFAAIFEASVQGGTDPKTRYLSFELRGDGAAPSISLTGPPVFGDEGGELNFGKLSLGRSHEVRMALRNDGMLPATARVDWKFNENFTVTCPSSVPLNRGEQRPFSVQFHPRKKGDMDAEFSIRTVGNMYEDVAIKLLGQGYEEDIGWDLTGVRRPAARAGVRSEEVSESAMPPAPDHLEMGEIMIGGEERLTFYLTNDSKDVLRFQFPETMPDPFGEQLVVEPLQGFVEPMGGRHPITVTLRPTAVLSAEKVNLACQTVSIEYEPGSASAADDTMMPGDRPFTEIDGTSNELPLYVSAMADEMKLECDVEEIVFKPTTMFVVAVWRFTIKNPTTIAAPYEWRVRGKTANSFTVSPTDGVVEPGGEKEIEVRFMPTEIENFECQLHCYLDGNSSEPHLNIPLTGKANRPYVHIELPPCDYKNKRQADTPLDPKYRVMEITSLGTHVKNTKRFYIFNSTAEPLEFMWIRDSANPSSDAVMLNEDDDDPFRCLTKRGTILPGKKFENIFEFAPQTIDTKESFWRFLLVGPKVEEHFLVAGVVDEPRVGMNLPTINLGERLLESSISEKVLLVNKEHIPFSFEFDSASYQIEGQPPCVSVAPTHGVVGPDGTTEIHVTFKPLEEKAFNFNIVCRIKRKNEPVVLNVKGIGYKIHATLEVDEPTGRRVFFPGIPDILDLGLLQVMEQRSTTLYLKNGSKRNFNFRALLQSGANNKPRPIGTIERPPYVSLSVTDGVAAHHEETPLELQYVPKDAHALDGSTLLIAIPSGPKDDFFQIQLSGGAKRSRVEFSFLSHDFGPCFIARGGATMAGEAVAMSENQGEENVVLVVTNRDDTDCLISANFPKETWFDIKLDATMIQSGDSIQIPIIFSPREAVEYVQPIEFIVNDYTRTTVDIRGRGVPLRLELTDLAMQNVDFGVSKGGEPMQKTVRVVNRSVRPVTFELCDQNGELLERAITWTPSHPTTLRPRETCEVDVRFAPTYRIAGFRMPLIARCSHGQDVRLLQVAGTCHSMELRLSEHSVFFGDVVVGSEATRTVRLNNFGDLGAKYRFDVPAKYAKVFSIAPLEGFIRPNEEIPLTVSFHPTSNSIQEFKRMDRQAAMRRGKKADADPNQFTISVKDVRCLLEGSEPLTLEASGRCVTTVVEQQLLTFATEVRVPKQNSFGITNPTDHDWKLHPQVQTTEPGGMNFFSCPREIVAPAGKETMVDVTYCPLLMTEEAAAVEEGQEGDARPAPASRSSRLPVHRGSVFVGTPDGNAVSYTLEGTASAPQCDNRIEVEIPCKKQHSQRVPVKNWFPSKQRFDVQLELVEPEPGSAAASGISFQGVKTLDLPPNVEREYKFNIYARHEGTALMRVLLTSQETQEFMTVEVAFSFVAAQSLAVIDMKAACRQLARHKIALANPLNQETTFTGSCGHPDFRFVPDTVTVPAKSERTIELHFRPIVEGADTCEATIKSDDLGTYPYTVNWQATAPGLERTLVLKAPLGLSVVESFKFMHWSKQAVTYTASIEAAPSHKGNREDFIVEASTVNAAAADSNGTEVAIEVRYQPSSLGECRAMLVVTGAGGGEYKALITGFAQPPQPQGPFVVYNGKGATPIEFRNPFSVATDFSMQVDNPAFVVPARTVRVDPQKSQPIQVTFKADKAMGGRLIVSCPGASTPWIFFLKGEL
eukprot:TRINITY_DN111574_c0_g1_i1.p1 TRINITY_DN111574_c0_g1~~TRINITY_DN111574_c0_g1_i1.p1  ORF type:complete len:5027 (+),score=1455.52 TRINITY_DN111574_c0_g1_i1:94-15081(+)